MQLTPAVRALLVINVLVFFINSALGNTLDSQYGLYSVLSDRFNPVQIITHMFLHAGFGHILSNMFGLFVFGPLLERTWGPRRFLFFYFFSGLGAAALYSAINYYEVAGLYEAVRSYRMAPNPVAFSAFVDQHAGVIYEGVAKFIAAYTAHPTDKQLVATSVEVVNHFFSAQVSVPMVGASGAIFGVIMAFGLLFPNTELVLLFPPIPIKAKWLVIGYGAYELYAGIHPTQSDNVAHFAHIGGMLFGFILVKYWATQRQNFY
jgi:membrane associated rhomboid family serine protease